MKEQRSQSNRFSSGNNRMVSLEKIVFGITRILTYIILFCACFFRRGHIVNIDDRTGLRLSGLKDPSQSTEGGGFAGSHRLATGKAHGNRAGHRRLSGVTTRRFGQGR